MKNLVDAFTDFDVTKEKHQGIINNLINPLYVHHIIRMISSLSKKIKKQHR